MSRPMRGDFVIYKEKGYFFQPNRSSCYLYDEQRDVGRISRAKETPNSLLVRKATIKEKKAMIFYHSVAASRCPIDILSGRLTMLEENRNFYDDCYSSSDANISEDLCSSDSQ